MAESSEFTPDQTRLHQFWGNAWSTLRNSDPASPEDMAETFMSVATAAFAAVCGWATAAARLRMVATNFTLEAAKRDAEGGAAPTVDPVIVAFEQFKKTARVLSDCGVSDAAVIDGMLVVSVNSLVTFAGRDGAVAVLEHAIELIRAGEEVKPRALH